MDTSFFFIDRVTEFRDGESVRGVKVLPSGETLARGALSDGRAYPGALLVEAMAQLGGFLAERCFNRDGGPVHRAVLAQIQRAKMRPRAFPGDRLDLQCRLRSMLAEAVRVEGEVFCQSKLMARATLTFILRQVDEEAVHRQRSALYRIWTQELDGIAAIR